MDPTAPFTPTGAAGGEPDLELVAGCIAGDAAAWERFAATYRPVVLGIARRDLRRRGASDAENLAEDVAAEVFARLLANGCRALRGFDGRCSLAGWLAVVTSRAGARLLERRGRARTPLDAAAEVASTAEPPTELAEREERRAELRRKLETLAPRDRLALALFYDAGRSYKGVASALGVPLDRVGTLLARARARLARALGLS
jgi:RNA polymerase sigma-70 factor (ECF subfamily)